MIWNMPWRAFTAFSMFWACAAVPARRAEAARMAKVFFIRLSLRDVLHDTHRAKLT